MRSHRTVLGKWAPRLAATILAAALALAAAGPALADGDSDGTGFDPGDTRFGLADMNAVLGTNWTNSLRDHQDDVERNGVSSCVGCHDIEGVGYTNDYAPGCLTCHDGEFCGTPGSSGLGICRGDTSNVVISQGNLIMNSVLGVDWTIPVESHPDYVERNGVDDCVGCHDLDVGGKPSASNFDGQGCLSCHGVEWDTGGGGGDDGDSDSDSDSDGGGDWRSSWSSSAYTSWSRSWDDSDSDSD